MKSLFIWIILIHSYAVSAAVGAFDKNNEEIDYNKGGCVNASYANSVTSKLNLEEFGKELTRSNQKSKLVATRPESLQYYCGTLIGSQNGYTIADGTYNAFYWGDPPEEFYQNIPGDILGECICIRSARKWVPRWPGSPDGRWELVNMMSAVTCKQHQKDRARRK